MYVCDLRGIEAGGKKDEKEIEIFGENSNFLIHSPNAHEAKVRPGRAGIENTIQLSHVYPVT